MYADKFKNKTPSEIWYKSKLDLSHVKVFGSVCYNEAPTEKRAKCIMLGYASSKFCYRLWDIDNDKLIIGRHVTFNEREIVALPSTAEIYDSETEDGREVEKGAENNFVEGNHNESVAHLEQEDVEDNHILRQSNRSQHQLDRYSARARNDSTLANNANGRVDWLKWKKTV